MTVYLLLEKYKAKINFLLLFAIGCGTAIPPLHAQPFQSTSHINGTPASFGNAQFVDVNDAATDERKLPPLPLSVKKSRYRIDIFLPVNAENYLTGGQRNHIRLNALADEALDFYKGLKMATQKLNREGVKLDLYIHDVGAKGALSAELDTDKSLLSSDLMIGFLPSEQLPEIARVAARREINFISAFSPSDAEVYYNPYFILLQPTLSTHIQKLVAFAKQKYVNPVAVLLYDDQSPLQKESKKYFDDALKHAAYDSISVTALLKDPEALPGKLYDHRENVLYVNLLSTKQAELVLKQLEKIPEKYRLAVFGMPTWQYIRGIAAATKQDNLEIYFSSPFYYDRKSPEAIQLDKQYRPEFGGTPAAITFRGYETLLWVTNLLQQYGTSFNKNIRDSRTTPFTRFQAEPVWTKDNQFRYFENQQLYIFHYWDSYFNVVE